MTKFAKMYLFKINAYISECYTRFFVLGRKQLVMLNTLLLRLGGLGHVTP